MKRIRSKYQQKTLQEIEYNLFEHSCYACDNVFMIDFEFIQIRRDENGDSYYKIICPYCGKVNYLAT